jgi:hypothetical protein
VSTPTEGVRRLWLVAAGVVIAAATVAVVAGWSISGGGSDGPTSTARAYANTVLAYNGKPFTANGKAICGFFTPHLQQVYADQAAQQGATTSAQATCSFLLNGGIGYPHENTKSHFVGGRLVSVGGERRVVAQGVSYVGVSLRARFDGEWSGYAIGHRSGERFSRIVDDMVWLQQLPGGRWRLAKPSLILDAALASDILIDPAVRARLTPPLAPPPDPQLLTQAERRAADTHAYRASLRTPEHGRLSCPGHATVYQDSHNDLYGYGPTAKGGYGPIHRTNSSNGDIDKVAVTYNGLGRGACVTVTFTTAPRSPLAIDFNPTGADLFDAQVYLVDNNKVRAGTMSADHYQLPNPPAGDPFATQALHSQSVTAVAVSDRTVSFRVAPETALGIHPQPNISAKPLRWIVRVTVPSQNASDLVPGTNPKPSENLGIDQATGRVVSRY